MFSKEDPSIVLAMWSTSQAARRFPLLTFDFAPPTNVERKAMSKEENTKKEGKEIKEEKIHVFILTKEDRNALHQVSYQVFVILLSFASLSMSLPPLQ